MIFMSESKLKVDIRRGKIMELLQHDGKVYVTELSRTLGVTPVTIRNDLDVLEKSGYLVRMSGGAILPNRAKGKAAERPCVPSVPQMQEKEAIAQAVLKMVHDGDTLFINSGTTTQIIASALRERSHLNIVTNSLAVASALENMPAFRVIILGGELNTKYGFTYGADAQEKLSQYHADWAILSVDGVSAETGITTYHAEEAIIDCQMIGGAKQVLITADHTKIGRAGFMKICDCTADMRIVTNKCQSEALACLLQSGIAVTECPF